MYKTNAHLILFYINFTQPFQYLCAALSALLSVWRTILSLSVELHLQYNCPTLHSVFVPQSDKMQHIEPRYVHIKWPDISLW